jgi:hypothetical protein|tara:strand:+ start:972 stop:1130 length:159 start_codon:yes stop_codon:yes gene_type:complete
MKKEQHTIEPQDKFNGYASLEEWNEEIRGHAQVALFKKYQEESKKLETAEFV